MSKLKVNSMYTPIKVVNMAITILLMFGFRFLPPFGSVTPVGMSLIGVFLGVIWGYSTCDIIWPSLLAFIAYGTAGHVSMAEAITSMMGHQIVFQVIVAFISIGALSYYGFGKWFVRWSLSLPIFRGKPMFYTWCFITLFGLSALVINQIQLQILLYAIWIDIAKNCGYKKDSNFIYFGMAGILLATVLGGCLVPYHSWMLGLALNWAEMTGVPLNFGQMGLMTTILTVLIMTLYVFAMRYVFHVDFSTMQSFDLEKLGEESKHLRPRAKRILIVYLLSVFVIILGNTFPEGSWVNDVVNNVIGVGGIYCICCVILMLLPSGEKDGEPCIIFNRIKDTAISWPVILMCAVTLPIASAVTSPDTGIVPWLSTVFEPLFAGRGGVFILVFTIIVSMLLTNFGSNIAFGAAMIPIIAPFVMRAGMNPEFAGAALIYVINIGLVLPGASAPAAIFHSNEHLPIASKRIQATLTCCACVLIVAIPYFAILGTLFG